MTPACFADIDGGRIVLRTPFSCLLLCKRIPDASWDSRRKAWTYPATRRHATLVRTTIPGLASSERFQALLAARPKPRRIAPPVGLKTIPWRHQLAAYEFAMDRFESGSTGVLLAMAMGTGKSLVASMVMLGTSAQRTLIVSPLRVVPVWIDQFRRHLSVRIVTVALDEDAGSVAGKQKLAEEKLRLAETTGLPFVAVINYDSVWREPFAEWALKQNWDLVIADECVPAGTKIATPNGDRPIESIQAGDKVLGFDHRSLSMVTATVTRTFRRRTRTSLVEIGSTRLTPAHPVWVENNGYTPAVRVSLQDYIRRINADGRVEVRMVRDLVSTAEAPEVLQPIVLGQVAHVQAGLRGQTEHPQASRGLPPSHAASSPQSPSNGKSSVLSTFQPQSIPRSGEAFRVQQQNPPEAVGIWISHAERRKWQRAYSSAALAVQSPRLAYRVYRANEGSTWLSVPLQAGHCQSGTQDCDRSGRSKSLEQGDPSQGHQEDAVSGRAGMDGSAFPECGSIGESFRGPAGDSGGHVVYNLETTSGNYFADGLLVHNCHRLKAPGGKASLYFKGLRNHTRYRLGLTGTPMPHSPLDVYAQFRFLDPSIFGPSFNAFKQKYAVMGGFENKQVTGYKNLEDLERLMRQATFRVGKDILELPPQTHITFHCALSPQCQAIYRSVEEDFIAEVQGGTITAANAMVALLRLQQITGGWVKTDDGRYRRVDFAKQRLLADVLDDIGPEEPVVIFCRFHADLDAVHEACASLGRTSLELSGRRDELARWQSGQGQVLAAQISSGGVGIDLSRARYSIYYSLSFSLGEYDQSLSRIHRPGQTRPVEHIHLVARRTVDERIMRAIERRAEVIQAILAEIKR
jgi:superfamily II DNA or RNA helicase